MGRCRRDRQHEGSPNSSANCPRADDNRVYPSIYLWESQSSFLTLYQTKPEEVVAIGWRNVVAKRRLHVVRVVVPDATTIHDPRLIFFSINWYYNFHTSRFRYQLHPITPKMAIPTIPLPVIYQGVSLVFTT